VEPHWTALPFISCPVSSSNSDNSFLKALCWFFLSSIHIPAGFINWKAEDFMKKKLVWTDCGIQDNNLVYKELRKSRI
jgi:hypothetical protein